MAYDYVIGGAGSAGGVIAGLLTEDPAVRGTECDWACSYGRRNGHAL